MTNSTTTHSVATKVTLLLASTLTVMAGATIAPSLPQMQKHFEGVENVELLVRLVLTVPALFIAIASSAIGVIVDRFGRKPLLIFSAAVYGLAGSSGFISNSLPSIILGRVFLGFAVAGIMVSATTLIADYYQGATRANFMGLQAAFMGFGGVLFLSAGGLVADLNWRNPFLIYLFAWLLLPLMVLNIYEPNRSPREKNSQLNDPNLEVKAPKKLLIFIYATALLTQIIFYLIPVQIPFYLKTLVNANASQSGLAIASCTLFSATASLNYGKIKQKLDFLSILAMSLGLIGVGYTLIGFGSNYAGVLFGLAIAGMGLGLLMPNLNLWVSSEVPDLIRGRVLGGLTTFFFLGQFLSPIATQPISKQLGLSFTYGLAGGLLLLLGLLLAALRKK
ncbi:MAG: MFS transporter [Xenococcaceae cyanobacterium]